jgi:hypothetical protein
MNSFEAVGLKKDGTTFTGEILLGKKSIIYQGQKARVAGSRDITAMEARRLCQSEVRNRILYAIPDLIFLV